MDRQIDKNRQIDEKQIDGEMGGLMDGYINGVTYGWIEEWNNRLIDKQM